MESPRPGFLSGFLPTFTRTLRSALPGKKALILFVVLAVPPILTFPAQNAPAHGRDEVLLTLVLFLYLQFLVPVTGLLFGTGILLDEASGGTLPYLFTRPVPRSSIILGKYTASLLLGALFLAVSLGATLLLYGPVPVPESGRSPLPDAFAARAFAAVLLAVPAYLAVFTLLSALTKWALLGGFLYAFGFEGFLSLIPGKVKEATLLYYSRSFLGTWESKRIAAGFILGKEKHGASIGTSATVLILVTVVSLALCLWILKKKEFVSRDPGQA